MGALSNNAAGIVGLAKSCFFIQTTICLLEVYCKRYFGIFQTITNHAPFGILNVFFVPLVDPLNVLFGIKFFYDATVSLIL